MSSPAHLSLARVCRSVIVLVAAVLLSGPALSRPLDSSDRAALIGPVDEAAVSNAALRFAWTPAPGAREHYLVVSSAPFDTRGLTRLPAGGEFQVVRVAHPVATWSDLRRDPTEDVRLYWAAAGVDPSTGRTTFSEVRAVRVLRPFSNRAEASPLLSMSPIGRAEPESHGPWRIHLEAGFDIDPSQGEPRVPDALRSSAAPVSARRSYVVYYGDADPGETRESIESAGGQVFSYLPDHAFLVRLGASDELSLATPGAWVGAYLPAYKLSPRLSAEATARQVVSVLLFPDANVQSAESAARSAGAEVLASSDNGINKILRLALPLPSIEAMAREPDVAWIEPWTAPEALNDQAQWVVQTGLTNNRKLWDMGLKGEGQVVMTTDSGINTKHFQFKDPLYPIDGFGDYPDHRKLIAYRAGSNDPGIEFGDHSSHGTHTACSVGGNDDPLSNSARDGMAKNAKLWFADLSGSALGNSMIPPPDLNDLYQPGYTGNGGGAARIASNSWGGGAGGGYTLDSYTVDQFMWNHKDFLLFFSNGNGGDGGAQTVASPATAKDCVSVGAVNNGAGLNTYATYTSRGPTADGRRKPTLCSTGSNVVSATTDSMTYSSFSGTSMASPTAAGCTALIRQYFTEGWYPTGAKVPANGFTPSAALLKAVCIASCDNTISGFTAPDNNVGWGRIDADRALYFSGDTRRLLVLDSDQGLGGGQQVEFQVNVVDGSQPLEVTLVWTDYPGSPVASVQLVNDLDLQVKKGASTYLGNWLPGGVSATGGTRDLLNVEEGVRLPTPSTGVWTVKVIGTSVPIGPQPFAVVLTGGLGTTAGTLALDRASYGIPGPVRVRLTDTNAPSSVNVTVSSGSEPAGETVTLTGSDGVLEGSIPLSPYIGSGGDGTLFVSNQDVITAAYADAAPVASVTAKATVGLEPPQVTNVNAVPAGSGKVIVTWTTNRSADSKVEFGATAALGQSSGLDPAEVLQHSVTLTGLDVGQTYYFDVLSRDLNDNETRDDNAGAHYAFTAAAHSDVLLVYDGFLFERPDRYTDAFAATGWTYDVWQDELSADPELGDSVTGLRSYAAVWWQNGLENYPPFSDAARDALTAYLDGGGRLAVTGHDLCWANQDPGSPYYTTDRANWVTNTLHAQFSDDPLNWSGVTGVAADPISGAYSGGAPYTPHRQGGAGDEVNAAGSGTSVVDWNSGDSNGSNPCGFRWESAGAVGTTGVGVWGGYPSRIASMFFEWSGLDVSGPSSTLRNDVLDKTLDWLIGRHHPEVTVVAPNGSEVYDAASVQVSWTEATFGSTSVQNRTLEYSLDGGQSWVAIATGVGSSPYDWDVTGIPNTARARVRVRIADSGTPTLTGIDASNADFAIARSGNDAQGPRVLAGSLHCDPNPIDNLVEATLVGTLSDAGTGGAGVTAAEWSFGDIPAEPGSGQSMAGAVGNTTVNVSALLNTSNFAPGLHRLWVRGKDANGNWGPPGWLAIVVNGTAPASVDPLPRDYGLAAAFPDPAIARVSIGWALPKRGVVDLAVYDVTGRQVRSLARGDEPAGIHQVTWDLRDDSGDLVKAGVYYYRLAVAGRMFTRRLVALN